MPLSSPNVDSTFRGLLDAAPDGILAIDRQGKIILANAQCSKLFGWDTKDLIGQSVDVLVPDAVRRHHEGLRDSYFKQPRTRPMGTNMELLAQRRDGSTLPVEISLSPFELDGKPCAIAVVRDVTESRRTDRDLKRANAELKRSNEELEQFAYVASHDLQEPLRMVSGYTQLLKRRYGEKLDGEAHEYMDFTVDGVKRMQTLINDLLAFSRLSSRAKAYVPVDMQDVLRHALGNLTAAIEESKAKVTVGPLPTLPGDRTQLVQLSQNLIANSLKFRRPGAVPEVSVSAVKDRDGWCFAFKDNGIGIDKAYAEKIFVIFQRLHTREQYPGTGIGLAICKKIVERHDGKIWFESTLDQGTTFFFRLPSSHAQEKS